MEEFVSAMGTAAGIGLAIQIILSTLGGVLLLCLALLVAWWTDL